MPDRPVIEPTVAHQHMKAVDAARQKCNGPPRSRRGVLRGIRPEVSINGIGDGIPPQLVHQACAV